MQTRFVIFASARTGSTMLVSILQSIQQVFCLLAIFGEVGWAKEFAVQQLRKTLDPKWDDLATREQAPFALLDEINAAVGAPFEALGFKHHFNMAASVSQAMIDAKDVRKIVLRRDNELAAFASQLAARRLRLGGTEPLFFASRPFVNFCRRRTEASEPWTEPLRQVGALEVTYSEVRHEVGRVLSYLGLPADVEREALVPKRGSDDILSRFHNPEAAAIHLKAIGREDWAFEA